MKRFLILAASLYLYISSATGQAMPANISFNNEASDTARLTGILVEAIEKDPHSRRAPQSFVAEMADSFSVRPIRVARSKGKTRCCASTLTGWTARLL